MADQGLLKTTGGVVQATSVTESAGQVSNFKTADFGSEFDNGNQSGPTFAINWNNGQKQRVTLTGNITFSFTNPPGACNLLVRLVQDPTGGRTGAWPAALRWAGGVTPTLTTDPNAIDIVSFYFDGTNYHAVSNLDFKP